MWTGLDWTGGCSTVLPRDGGGAVAKCGHKNCKTWQEMEHWLNAYGIKEVRVGERGLWKRAWRLFNIQNPSPDRTLLSINIVGRQINTAITAFPTPHIRANSIKAPKSFPHEEQIRENESNCRSPSDLAIIVLLSNVQIQDSPNPY